MAEPARLSPTHDRSVRFALRTGDRLSAAEFHRRYRHMPDDTTFELIGGIVYMASPVWRPHAQTHFAVAHLLRHYQLHTPGVDGGDNQSVRLTPDDEVQPDLYLRLDERLGGTSRWEQGGRDADSLMLVGGPELVVEIASSSVAHDTHIKLDAYIRGGVREYVIVVAGSGDFHAWRLPEREAMTPDGDGIWRSRLFPGLWLDAAAIAAGDGAKALATVSAGIAGAEWQAFAAHARDRAQSGPDEPLRE
jgi:Uma2 family endonuclease